MPDPSNERTFAVPTYRATVEVAAPPDAVHDLVADVTRHPDWTDDPIEVEQAGTDRFRTAAVSRGRTITADVHVVEADTPGPVVLDVTDATGHWRHTFSITPTGQGCRVVRTISGDLSLPQALLYWLVLLPIKLPSNRRSLERLRALAEGG